MKRLALLAGIGVAAAISQPAQAADTNASIYALTAEGTGAALGTVMLVDRPDGLLLIPALKGLPPGPHGFHVHDKGSCAASTADGKPMPGGGAGGHYDPAGTGKHLGPEGTGHAGDLPFLTVAADGSATKPVVAPHLHLDQVHGHALIIHAGGDNYADTPAPLGGGGARIACGVVP